MGNKPLKKKNYLHVNTMMVIMKMLMMMVLMKMLMMMLEMHLAFPHPAPTCQLLICRIKGIISRRHCKTPPLPPHAALYTSLYTSVDTSSQHCTQCTMLIVNPI